jgi:hypothetical protein
MAIWVHDDDAAHAPFAHESLDLRQRLLAHQAEALSQCILVWSCRLRVHCGTSNCAN